MFLTFVLAQCFVCSQAKAEITLLFSMVSILRLMNRTLGFFCRGANIPEPLARVLEPVSVRHLDSEGGGVIVEPVRRLTRHGSMEGEDPGVIGPLVWDVHCHRVQHQGSEL